MVPAFHLLLRGLDGRTSCLRFPTGIVTGSLIQEHISAALRLPANSFLTFTGIALVHSHTSFSADANGFFPSCSIAARLRGGKGGFGSLLRGAAIKAGQKKTSNFDACRDMSGRRLRHVNAEKKLKEWKAQAKERDLEKAANEFLKKQAKRKEDDSGWSQVIEKFRGQASRAREEVESAVASGLLEAKKFGKRKVIDDDLLPSSSAKRAHTWSNFYVIDNNEIENATDRSGDDSEKGFELENGNKGIDALNAEGVSENGKFEGFKMEVGLKSADNGELEKSIKCTKAGDQNHIVVSDRRFEGRPEEKLRGEHCICDLTVHAERTVHTLEVVATDSSSPKASHPHAYPEQCEAKTENDQAISNLPHAESPPMRLPNIMEHIQETLKFDNFFHASDLEVLGLDRLKLELQMRGLKCSGSLAERAGRLILLKTTPLEKLDKKHFAKARG